MGTELLIQEHAQSKTRLNHKDTITLRAPVVHTFNFVYLRAALGQVSLWLLLL